MRNLRVRLLAFGAATHLLGVQRLEVDRLQQERREAAILDQVGHDLARVREQHVRAVGRQHRIAVGHVEAAHAEHAGLLDRAAPHFRAGAGLAWATKGFDPPSGCFLHEIAAQKLPHAPAAIVTGPSFAREVAQGLPTAVTVHSATAVFAQRVAELLHCTHFRAYTGSDMTGAELGGAMKNVLAVATGVADGMKLGLNARAGMITRGLNEMLRLGAALGARPETLMGLAGLGDLVLTCTGDLSRNRRLGLALGRGVPLPEAVAEIGQVVESIETVDTIMRLALRHGLDLPIAAGVQRVLHEEITPAEALRQLLAREQKPEYPGA